MCRLVVCGPNRQAEVAVPSQVLVADLLPVLLSQLGAELADAGLTHGGWVLQRLGAVPFDEDSSVASLGLHDGDVVHLRPRAAQIPPVDFDDLIDGVATGIRGRVGRWRPEMLRGITPALLAVLFAVALVGTALPGAPAIRALVAGGVAVGALIAAFALTRAAGERWFGVVLVVGAVAFAALSGASVPDAPRTSAPLVFGGPQLFAGSVAAVAVAALGGLLIGWAGPFIAGTVTAGLFAVLGAALAGFAHLAGYRAAAVVAVVASVGVVTVPLLAFRLSGLRLAPLPTEPEHLQQEIEPEPAERLLRRTASADRYMTGLYAGLGAATAVGLAMVAGQRGWLPVALVAAVSLARVLSARPMTSLWHRLAASVPAVLGLAVAMLAVSDRLGSPVRYAVPVGLLVVAVPVLVAAGRTLPGRRMMPYWGQFGDITQMVATVAMFPLLLGVLDVFGAVRALGG
jgi:type VII secretion integral membrane protein EccD